jgi:amidase
MSTTDWSFASATDIARAIRSGQLTSSEILEHYLARIEQHNPALNAVVVLDAEHARAAAKAADQAISKGEVTGPLHGVPMTIKEAFNINGLATTWGLPELSDNIADSDAVAVQRFRQAGAIVFGKTNVPAALSDWQSFNAIYGTTNNPWDLTRTPGGSSGGSACALAAGLSALEAGSDIGASIRNPAHYCGVYGHKPTFGVITTRGHELPDWSGYPELDIAVTGPMARSADDLQIAMAAMAGPDDIDALGWQLALPPCDRSSLKDFTVGIVYSDEQAEVDDAVQQQLRALKDFLVDAGVSVREQHLPDIDTAEIHRNYLALLRAATSFGLDDSAFASLQSRAAATDAAAIDYESRMILGTTMTHREWLYHNEQRHRMRLKWQAYFADTDLLLCPAATTAAFEHNHQGERWERMLDVNGKPQPTTTPLFWAGLAGHVYLPATVAPIGLVQSQGVALPVGVQIIGPQYRDYRCIGFAQLLERHYYKFHAPAAFQ